MWSHTDLPLSTKEINLNLFLDKFLLYKMKFRSFIFLVYTLYIGQRGGGGGRAVRPLLPEVFLLLAYFFLRTASLICPESQFYQPYTNPFFRGRAIREQNNWKLVFYVTLLQSYKTLQHKIKLRLSVFQPSLGTELRSCTTFVPKPLSSNSNLGMIECFNAFNAEQYSHFPLHFK
jgi:hypothetical protein